MRDLVEERTGTRPPGPVRLLTTLRTFGHSFNPVIFYYCFARGGERVEAVVADVTNTPWGESHAYVLSREGEERRSCATRWTRSSTCRRSSGWTATTTGA